MSSDVRNDEKMLVLPVSGSVDDHLGLQNATNDLALEILEKRVLKKTDMVILPMVGHISIL